MVRSCDYLYTTIYNHKIYNDEKKTLYLLTASLSLALLSTQATHAQTNTATGFEALLSNTGGVHNSAFGYQAMRFNNGYWNTANGSRALLNNSTGSLNTAVGYQALLSNTTGIITRQ
jgi:hypothetical protein